jgi:hypothetical protein
MKTLPDEARHGETVPDNALPVPRLDRRADGRLWLEWNGGAAAVSVNRCFPWSRRSRFISLRDDERQERWLVEDPAELDAYSREILEDALVEADFVFEITAIRQVEEEIEIRCWQVETRQGARSFQTRRDDWPRAMPGGGLLVRDVAGDLYLIATPENLDKHSRAEIAGFVD